MVRITMEQRLAGLFVLMMMAVASCQQETAGPKDTTSNSVIGDTVDDNSSSAPEEKPKPGLLEEEAPLEKDGITAQSSASNRHVTVTTHLDRNVLRPGDSFHLAVVVNVKDGWHIYGNPVGPGIGRPTVISAQTPNGFLFEPARYAPAHKAEQNFGDSNETWVWEHTGKTVRYLSGTVSDDIPLGDYQWMIEVSGQVCTETTCLPGKAVVPLTIQIVEKSSLTAAANVELFDDFQNAKPAPDKAEK